MNVAGWNLLVSDAATNRQLRTLRQTVAEGSWNGKLVLSRKAMQVFRPGFTHKAVYGGRVTEKTTTIALYIIARMEAAYTRVVCLRKRLVSLRHSSMQSLKDAIRMLGLQDRFDVLHNEIIHKENGSLAFFKGLESDAEETMRGTQGVDVFWLDEARNVSYKDFMEVVRALRRRGAELISSWNPLDPEDACDKYYRGDNPPQDLLKVHLQHEDSATFATSPAAKEYHRLLAEDPQLHAHVYGGGYDVFKGERVYTKFKVGIVPRQYLEGATCHYGLDLGYVDDPTVATKTWLNPRYGLIYVEKEAVGYGEDVDGIADLLNAVLDSKDDDVISDNSEPRTTDGLNNKGYSINRTRKNVVGKSVVEGVREIGGYAAQYIHPECTETIDETKHYKWKIDRVTGKRLQQVRKGHDHCWDSIRYAVMGRDLVEANDGVGVMRIPGW
ncbi:MULTISPECIES: phage terminase large subunit [unclassified Mesorhizobium]|uniref:PBSX family phage terminase large subunit n=1 Tax=unclassified Mesorhizobium TaxID=325217 RepID=UPI000FCB8713|nr:MULTISPECIES: phage terminase large subunit [unclassified Mesorhizobium]RUX97432.1 hypothetical protein EN993_03785 [Mesorhizobium sp. M7D.F.Ca.US.004.01.2.1]RVA36618.1 hypothetical protein EN935_01595 [Mesorhizobium sp. M7D.F.Ca.US.004.03.1.1]